ncbi:MAG: amino acid adenylation domain-containing protein, partial [Algicola sp.]|nr:amino acid adenylation domain-containing protein [Algicola sp.]
LPLFIQNMFNQNVANQNATMAHQPHQGIHQLFEQNARLNPHAIALIDGDLALSYQQLNYKANQLAHHLIAQGVTPDSLVGLCVSRSRDMIIGILAILKAGGAYLPLDPKYPQNRLDYMVRDSGINWLLTHTNTAPCVKSQSVQKLLLDSDELAQVLQSLPSNDPQLGSLQSAHLAYVIYTSGSTGQPKGVMVNHENVLSYCYAAQQNYAIEPADNMLQFSSVSFDIFVEEAFMALSFGATLVLRDEQMIAGGDDFWQFCRCHQITAMSLPTAYWHMLCEQLNAQTDLADLRLLIVGGEAMSLSLLQRWQAEVGKDIQLFNTYGPTEGTVIATAFDVANLSDGHYCLPIGKAVNNSYCLVLDEHLNLCPTGVFGQLHIGGAGLARGYLNQPALTETVFIQNPFSQALGQGQERLYKTGDLVRLLTDGNLEFNGRIDGQVKIRGFRIELAEIEHQLSLLPQVKSSMVLAIEDKPGQMHLVAYVTGHTTPNHTTANHTTASKSETANVLRATLKETLPDYMVPSFFVLLDEFPLTANGKVDKKALPVPDKTQVTQEFVQLTTATQITLAGIWAELLNIEAAKLGATANFFQSGGHSLLSLRVIGEVRAQFGVELQIRDVFDTSDLASLASLIDQNAGRATRPQIVALERKTNQLPPSFAQQRLWFIDQLDGNSVQYNMPGAMSFKGTFNEAIVEQAFSRIIARHEPLRTVFVDGEAGLLQLIRADFKFSLTTLDLTNLSPAAQQEAIQQAIQADADKVFDLAQDLMLRSTFIRLSSEQGVLLFNTHHIASDGWSMGTRVNEY